MKSKKLLESKTVLWAIVMFLPALLNILGIEFTQEEIDLLGQNLNTIIEALLLVIGFGVTIYGRRKAKTPLTF